MSMAHGHHEEQLAAAHATLHESVVRLSSRARERAVRTTRLEERPRPWRIRRSHTEPECHAIEDPANRERIS
jgi:hypothetical protein